jgi:hypothetical protein
MKNNTIITIGIALLVLAAAWGTMRATVAGNSREIIILQTEAAKRMEVLQGLSATSTKLTERLEALTWRVEKVEKDAD